MYIYIQKYLFLFLFLFFFIFLILYNIKINIEKKLLSIDTNIKIPINKLLNTDKIIWSYWHSDKLPLNIKISYNSWHKTNPNYIFCHINNNNLFHYLNKNELPKNYNSKQIQHKADIIRLIILEKYGGIWMDSSILLYKSIEEIWEPKNYDVGGFVLMTVIMNYILKIGLYQHQKNQH